MEMLKKCISIFLALQLVGATLVPTYAARDMYSNASIDSVDVSNDDTLSKHNNRIIIKFKDDKSRSKFKKSKGKKIKNKIKKEKDFKVKNKHYSIIDVEENENIDDLIQSISNEYNDEIEMVQPDYIISSFAKNEEIIIEDMDIADENVSVSQSTSATEENGMEDVLVAVIDTAIDYDHEALVNSVYMNSQELEDGIDNDGNGYVDDIIGWDFINNADMSQSKITSNHGTHVAGLIAADGVGVAENAMILPLNVFNDGVAYTSDIITAIEYAEQAGAKIVNCSWGSTADNPALEEAISNSDMLFVCAVGNRGINIDENPVYPASYDLDNIISVGACNDRDYMAYFSNYGASVDVVVNGYKVYSTIYFNYRYSR